MCMVDSNDVVEVLTSDGSDCTIVFNTMVEFQPGFTITRIMLMGPISMDGTTCDFAGTTAIVVLEDDNVVPAQVKVNSGTATLTFDGKVLGLSDIEVVNFADSPVTIPGFNCDCHSVEPIDQQARTQDAQRIQRQMMEDYSIDTGN